MKNLASVMLLTVVFATGCISSDRPDLSLEQRAAIADTVSRIARSVLDAYVEVDVEGFLGLHSTDIVMASDRGYITKSYDEFTSTYRGSFDALNGVDGTIEVMNVEILDHNAAVLNWRIELHMMMKDGNTFAHGALVTAVVAQQAGEWKIIRTHESGFPLDEHR